eukprot:COSAG06_NODE_12109_length_1422_cov_4.266818_2_plen_162_part_01
MRVTKQMVFQCLVFTVPADIHQSARAFPHRPAQSYLLDNYIPSADTETWNSWFQVDDGSEARFETMGEPLDPNGELQAAASPLCSAHSASQPASQPLPTCCADGSSRSTEVLCCVWSLPSAGVGGGIRWLSYRGIGNVSLRVETNMRAYPFDTQTIPVTVWH